MKRLVFLLLLLAVPAQAQFADRVTAGKQTFDDLWVQLQQTQALLAAAQQQSAADTATIQGLRTQIAALQAQLASVPACPPVVVCPVCPAPVVCPVPPPVVTDTQPPTTPTNLVATSVTPNQVNLAWSPSTDNVAVVSYQIYLNDVQIGTSPTTSFQHPGRLPGTTYNYRVSAADAVPNYSAWTAVLTVTTPPAAGPFPVPPPPPVGADADFMTRCIGANLCAGLDSETEVAASIEAAADGTRQGFVDTTVKTSGAGSLKFTLRAGKADKNLGGSFEKAMGSFGAGQTIYVQWRQRVSPEYLTNNLKSWDSSIKMINLHGASSTCQDSEFTTTTDPSPNGNWPSMYTACGIGFNADTVTNVLCDVGGCPNNIVRQQADKSPYVLSSGKLVPSPPPFNGYNCEYTNQVAGDGTTYSGCFFMKPNVWYTFYEVIKLGTRGTRNTTVDAYVAEPVVVSKPGVIPVVTVGGPYKQFQRARGVLWGSSGDATFTRARLETYMTEIAGAAPVNAFVWYDELIVSKNPILAPSN